MVNYELKYMAKILIIEDDLNYRNIYKEILSEKYQVEEAVDGEDGWNKASANDYDLILLDIVMPKLDGLGFLKKRKNNPKLQKVPVIMMTNLGQDEVLKKCLELDVKYYIIKAAFTPDKVMLVIEKTLQK
jgi:two-component system, chemotaxis family, sensor histidine kinase and response regulator WspE